MGIVCEGNCGELDSEKKGQGWTNMEADRKNYLKCQERTAYFIRSSYIGCKNGEK